MTRSLAGCVLACLAHVLLAPASASAAEKPTRMTFQSFVVGGRQFGGPLQGPWEFSGAVTVEAADMVMTCDRLKLWPPKGTGDPERVVATGNIRIEGRLRDADKAEWEIEGRSGSLTYERQSGTVVLKGSVSLKATNLTDGGVLSIGAATLTYDVSKQTFRLEEGDERVRVAFTRPESPKEPSSTPAEEPAGEDEGSTPAEEPAGEGDNGAPAEQPSAEDESN